MIRLPRFTLLCGPNGSGKSTLSRLLQEQDDSLCVCSFAEPIRLALLASFYPEEMTFGLDLRDESVKARLIPGTNMTNRQWMISYGDWLKEQCGPYIFVDIAKRTIESQRPYWQRFLFDDCRFLEEVDGLAGGYGKDEILVIHVERDGIFAHEAKDFGVTGHQGTPILGPSFPIPSINRVVVRNYNGKLERMLPQLAQHLGTFDLRTPA